MSKQSVSVLKPAGKGKPFPTPAETPCEVLERARLVLSPRGAWRHGAASGTHPKTKVYQRCAITAMNDCDGEHVTAAQNLFLKAAKELFPTRPSVTVPAFNDAATTTKTDVLAVFDRAIEIAKEA